MVMAGEGGAGGSMTAIQILQKIKADTEKLMPQVSEGSSRLYEISTNGTITERTAHVRAHFRRISRLLQGLIHRLRKTH
jgi:hypothetical protein